MPSDSDTRDAAASRPSDGAAPRVLVLHDSAMRALLTEQILTAAGCVVQTSIDAGELSALMESFQPDLILTAAPVPASSGIELAALSPGSDTPRVVPILLAAADHRRQSRTGTVPLGTTADGFPLLSPANLVAAVTQRIESMRARSQSLPAADGGEPDPDAGLATRRQFMRALGCALNAPDSAEPGNGLFVVALDAVSHIDRQLGTGAADLVTDRIGQLIAAHLAPGDLAVRLDDYRHAWLLRRPGAEALQEVAEVLRGLVAESPFQLGGHHATITVSIGIGLFRPAAADAVTMIKRAEHACAQAATGGGNRIIVDRSAVVGAPDETRERLLNQLLERALLLTQLVERALIASEAVGGFQIFYQPMVATGRQVLCHVEVILCLQAEDGALIPAADFLPVAERAGRIAEIDRWIMLCSLSVLTRQAQTQPRLRLFIRQHVESLLKDGWLAWLSARVAADGLVQRAPILDVDLHDLLRHRHVARSLVSALRKIGFQVCVAGVDDTPAALELMKELQPRFVKLAPTTVQQLQPAPLTHLVQRLSHSETEVIASGIDSHELVAPVWASGVGYAQGTVLDAPRSELAVGWDEVETEQVA